MVAKESRIIAYHVSQTIVQAAPPAARRGRGATPMTIKGNLFIKVEATRECRWSVRAISEL
jgi:hypothetical protein